MLRSPRQRETSRARLGTAPVALTIAGSDGSGGAGIQADLKVFTTLGVYGASAVTCVVAEHPGRVLNITAVPPARVGDQVRLVLEAFPVAAVKTGMLYSAGIIAAVERVLGPALRAGVPLVIDPVMVSSSGTVLLRRDGMAALRRLMRRAVLVTPNRDEAALLWGREIVDLASQTRAARELAGELGGPHILVKGGHLGTARAVDVLAAPGGAVRRFAVERIEGVDVHGTGCTYSAAITAGLARGLALPEAVARGKRLLTRAIRERLVIGRFEVLNPGGKGKR